MEITTLLTRRKMKVRTHVFTNTSLAACHMLLRKLLSLAARALLNGVPCRSVGGSLQEFSSYGMISWAPARFTLSRGAQKCF